MNTMCNLKRRKDI